MFSYKDIRVAALLGFLTALFAIPTIYHLGVRNVWLFAAMVAILPFGFVIDFLLLRLLRARLPSIIQFWKFVAVGFLNTAIDFALLNTLSLASGIAAGLVIGGVNLPGFAAAVSNGYFWNKFWVFKKRDGKHIFSDSHKFVLITGIGALLNSGIVVLLTTHTFMLYTVDTAVQLNIAKAAATVVSLVWNFLGYKFFVFSQRHDIFQKD